MAVHGIRGAVIADGNRKQDILSATKKLLEAIMENNPGLEVEDIASVLFTVTSDLTQVYPARAARDMGWDLVPLMCAREIPVPGSLPRCIRVLVHWNTDLPQSEIRHIYLGEAGKLRPDL